MTASSAPGRCPGSVAFRLRELRLARDLTQTELGRSIGVSGRTVRALESGGYIPSIRLACRIAQALDQPIETLFVR